MAKRQFRRSRAFLFLFLLLSLSPLSLSLVLSLYPLSLSSLSLSSLYPLSLSSLTPSLPFLSSSNSRFARPVHQKSLQRSSPIFICLSPSFSLFLVLFCLFSFSPLFSLPLITRKKAFRANICKLSPLSSPPPLSFHFCEEFFSHHHSLTLLSPPSPSPLIFEGAQ